MKEISLFNNARFDIQTIQNQCLVKGILLSEFDIIEFFEYQQTILEKLQWIESDAFKLEIILVPFLDSNWVHNENYKKICKTIIRNYYVIRKYFNLEINDEQIYRTLLNEFNRYSGMNLQTLKERTIACLKQEGGQRSNETKLIYRYTKY
ncbi:MAG: DUF6323 family protein [Floccifex sp.]